MSKFWGVSALLCFIWTNLALAQDTFIDSDDMDAIAGITSKARVGINPLKLNNPTTAQLRDMKVLVAPGVVYDAQKYIMATRLNERAELKPMFSKSFQRRNLQREPRYQEIVEAKNNELTVVRTLILDTENPCTQELKKVLNMCFEPRRKKISAAVKKDLAKVRNKIRYAKDLQNMPSVSRKALLAMNDTQLLDYLLNKQSSTKQITHKSVLPLVAYKYDYRLSVKQAKSLKRPIASASQLRSEIRRIKNTPKLDLASQSIQPTSSGPKPRVRRIPVGDPLTWENKREFSQQFLTGFTFGREFGDTYRVRFAPETWFSDEYYAKFTYNISAGFGLRFPFEVTGSSNITHVYEGPNDVVRDYPARELCSAANGNEAIAYYCAKTAMVNLSVTPFDASLADYKRLGVDASQEFNGKELVFEIGLSCNLYASIPGPNFSRSCPDQLEGFDFGRNFVPQIGARPKNLFKQTIPGRPLGIALETGIGYAALNPGVALQAIDGRLGFDVAPYRSKVSLSKLSLTDRDSRFDVTENIEVGRAASFGFEIRRPSYKVNTRLVPLIEIEIGIDLGVLGWDHKYGPYELDDLAIELAEFEFSAHEGSPSQMRVPRVGARANRKK